MPRDCVILSSTVFATSLASAHCSRPVGGARKVAPVARSLLSLRSGSLRPAHLELRDTMSASNVVETQVAEAVAALTAALDGVYVIREPIGFGRGGVSVR